VWFKTLNHLIALAVQTNSISLGSLNSMKKNLVLVIAITFLGASLTLPASAAVKAGGKCTTKGQVKISQGKKFTCVKSGNNLLWNKGILVNDPKSTVIPKVLPSQSPSSIPTIISLSAFPINYGDIKQPQFISGVQTPQEIDLSQNSGQIRLTVVMRDDLNSIQPFFFGLRRVDLINSFVGNSIFRTSVSKLIAQQSDATGITETFELLLDLPKGLAPGTYWLEGGIRDYANNWSNSENNPDKISFFPLLIVR
jgi:hypothetical protein